MPKRLFTIGHSTRSIEQLMDLLKAHCIERVIDVRSIPMSRFCPQFNQDNLRSALKKARIGYKHMKTLGGRRHTLKSSKNLGWKNSSFRGFADYMQTTSFQKAIDNLMEIAQEKTCAILCAEAVPWRCHRSLIADALTVQKWQVFHIQSKKTAKRHQKTSFLKVKKGLLTYPSLIK